MARGVNKVILIGNVGKDPEVRYFDSGDCVCNITMATSESWKDKNTGETVEKTEWHRVVFFRKLAEIVGEYVTKGMKIYVEGKLQTRKWQGQDGADRYTTEIVADSMQMLDRGPERPAGNQAAGRPAQQGQGRPASQRPANSAPAQQDMAGDFDDDIPF